MFINCAKYNGGCATLSRKSGKYAVDVYDSNGGHIARAEFDNVSTARQWRETNGKSLCNNR